MKQQMLRPNQCALMAPGEDRLVYRSGRLRVALPLLILVALTVSCAFLESTPSASPTQEVSEPQPARPQACGDGACSGPENPTNCAADCAGAADASEGLPSGSAGPPPQEPAVLYLGIMVHLEGWADATNENVFEGHAEAIREYATLFEAHGAKLTWESKETTQGIARWGDNVLLEMEQRGHGVGVHADVGGQLDDDCSRMAQQLRTMKEELGSLGVTVRHVSGIASHCDWVQAAVKAGYLFTTGQVAYSLMSLPVELRPPEYADCPNPGSCHQAYPPDLADRIHPWRASTGTDWLTHDPDGKLVLLPSSQVLPCMEELLSGSGQAKECDFNAADVDAFIGQLEQAIALSEPGQVNIYYVAWSLGGRLDSELLEDWLTRIDRYVASGQVEWKTLPEMYDAYVGWESRG